MRWTGMALLAGTACVAGLLMACGDDDATAKPPEVSIAGTGQYHITYDYKDTDGNTGTLVFAARPPKGLRDITYHQDGGPEQRQVTIFDSGHVSYFCQQSGDAKTCVADTSGAPSQIPGVVDVSRLAQLSAAKNARELDRRTIVGREARCFEIQQQDKSTLTLCVDATDGYLLLSQDPSVQYEATSIDFDPPDNLFQPPFPVATATAASATATATK